MEAKLCKTWNEVLEFLKKSEENLCHDTDMKFKIIPVVSVVTHTSREIYKGSSISLPVDIYEYNYVIQMEYI